MRCVLCILSSEKLNPELGFTTSPDKSSIGAAGPLTSGRGPYAERFHERKHLDRLTGGRRTRSHDPHWAVIRTEQATNLESKLVWPHQNKRALIRECVAMLPA